MEFSEPNFVTMPKRRIAKYSSLKQRFAETACGVFVEANFV